MNKLSTCTIFSVIALFLLLAQTVLGQTTPTPCATEEVVRKQLTTDTAYRAFFQAVQPAQDKSADDSTTLYTIPVVFVVYHLGEPVGTGSNVSDAALQLQVDLMNRMFGGERPTFVGPNANIRFVLARRSLSCGTFNGVARVDARSVPGYQASGLPYNDGTMINQLRNLVPDYSNSISSEFVTIRVVHQVSGAAGAWAYYGGDIVMPAGTLLNANSYNTVLTHEMGHALFLEHTFSGSYYDSPSGTYSCPSNNDPERDGDKVADTDPHRQNEPSNACEAFSESSMNGCSGRPFGLIGRNFMSYGCNLKLFTRGQIRRMRSYLTGGLQSLITSAYLSPPEGDVKTTCTPVTVRPSTPVRKGIVRVQFQTIDRQTEANPFQNGHYRDYACSDRTTVTAGQSYSLVIGAVGRHRRAYLDYNNDGAFNETNELVWASEQGTRGLITIPTDAVMDRQLRLRVVVDDGTTPPTACSLPGHPTEGSGEVEDYAVRILPADTPVSLSLGHMVSGIICRGQPTVIPISYMGAFGADNVFTAQLSDATGNFNNPIVIGSGAVGPVSVELPANLVLGSAYKVRVVSSNPVITTGSSPFLQLGETATATISGSQTPVSGTTTATLSFSLTGSKPWTFAFTKNGVNWGGLGGINQSPFSFTFVPNSSGIYELTSVSNVCGLGTTAGSTTILVPCTTPTDLFEFRYALTVMRMTWTSIWGNTYTIQWKEATATTWNSFTNVTTSGWLISGLEPGKTYRWRIKMHCLNGDSDWSEERAFVMDCPTPADILMSETTTLTSALLRWPGGGSNGFAYTIRWRLRDTGNWTEIPVGSASTYSLTGLTGGETYQWEVRTDCGTGGSSAYSGTRQFSTNCFPPSLSGSYNIRPTSASVYWVFTQGVRYQVRWKPTSSTIWIESDTTTIYNYANLRGLTNNTVYEWQVRSVCGPGLLSAYSNSYTFMTQCAPPAQLSAYELTPTVARLSWFGPSDGTYELRWRASTTTNWTSITGIVGTYYSLTGLTAGISYECQIKAVCSELISSGFSNSLFVFPTCNTATSMGENGVTSNSAQLRWYTATDVRYVVRWRAQGETSWLSSTTLTPFGGNSFYTHSITGLTGGTTYEWQVQSVCGGGITSMSGSRTFVATCLPPGPSGFAPNQTSASVYYGPLANTQTAQVRWRAVGTTTWTESLTTSISTYSIPNLQYGTTYEWQVRAICSPTDVSPYSNSSTFVMPCPMPNINTSQVGPTTARLNWSATGTSYDLRWRAVGAATWTTVSSLTTTSLSLTGLTTGTTYEWQVRTVCSSTLASDYQYQNTFTATCRLPSGMFEGNITGTSAQLSWYADAFLVYVLQWRVVGSPTWQSSTTMTTGYPNALTNLTTGTTYEWRVLTDCEGVLTPTASRTFTAQCGPLAANTLYSYGASSGAILLSWGGSYGSQIAYRVRYRPTGTTTWTESGTLTSTYTTIRGLTPNTTYEWQVQMSCGGDPGAYSASGPAFTTICRVPIAYDVTPGDTYSGLYWQNSESERYALDYRVLGSSVWTTVSNLTATGYSLTTVPGTAYEWRVRTACVDGSFTEYSNIVSFTALPACDPNEPNNSALTATPVSGSSFTLTGLCLNRPGDYDWFRWTVDGEVYYVVVNGYWSNVTGAYRLIGRVNNRVLTLSTAPENDVQTDTNLNLYAADGVTYRANNNDANGSVFSQITYNLPAPCTQMSTIRNGSWGDPGTWSCNRQPVATDNILISHEVFMYEYPGGRARQIRYGAGGKLRVMTAGKLLLGE